MVTYFPISIEFNEHLSLVYVKAMAYGKHQGLVAGFQACSFRKHMEQCQEYKPEVGGEFVKVVMCVGSRVYHYVCAIYRSYG